MNKDTDLIFEAYVEESKSRAAILGIMCALGLGCSSIQQQPGERPPVPSKEQDRIENLLQIIGPMIEAWLRSGVSDEQKHHLKVALLKQSAHGTPEEGWERWFHNWSNGQKI